MKLIYLFVIIGLLAACSAKPDIITHAESYSFDGENSLYVVSHGWHTGLVIPAKKIKAEIPELFERFGEAPYIEFGWGDKGFYQAKEITLGLTFQAIFWPTESVVHAVGVPEDVEVYFQNSEIQKLCLNDDELSSLVMFIVDSFAKSEQGRIISLENGIYGDSQFYQGAGDYYLMNTCNKWTAKGLKSIGMDIDPLFKLTAGSIMAYLKESKGAENQHLPSQQNCIGV